MPNKLKAGTLRVSYVESKQTFRALKLLATAKGTSLSLLLRSATEQYLDREDPSQELTRLAGKLAVEQADTNPERSMESLDPNTAKAVAALIKKFRS
jgi:hypothetical protein